MTGDPQEGEVIRRAIPKKERWRAIPKKERRRAIPKKERRRAILRWEPGRLGQVRPGLCTGSTGSKPSVGWWKNWADLANRHGMLELDTRITQVELWGTPVRFQSNVVDPVVEMVVMSIHGPLRPQTL